MIEISLQVIGYVVWIILLAIFSYAIIHFAQEKNQDLDHEWKYPLCIFLLIFVGGIFVGCNTVWGCPELVRFV